MNVLLAEISFSERQTLQLVRGDIAVETTDAIVNAANPYLRHGAGVAGAIVNQGGDGIQAESDAWVRTHGPVTHASPAWTSGGRLACRYVIHAVGPVWGEGDEDDKLAAAIIGSLDAAERLDLKSISIPALATGIFGFPKDRAARVILTTLRDYFQNKASMLALARIIVFEAQTAEIFERVWHDHFGA